MANNWYKGHDRREEKQKLRPGQGELGGSDQDISRLQKEGQQQGRKSAQGETNRESDRQSGKQSPRRGD